MCCPHCHTTTTGVPTPWRQHGSEWVVGLCGHIIWLGFFGPTTAPNPIWFRFILNGNTDRCNGAWETILAYWQKKAQKVRKIGINQFERFLGTNVKIIEKEQSWMRGKTAWTYRGNLQTFSFSWWKQNRLSCESAPFTQYPSQVISTLHGSGCESPSEVRTWTQTTSLLFPQTFLM